MNQTFQSIPGGPFYALRAPPYRCADEIFLINPLRESLVVYEGRGPRAQQPNTDPWPLFIHHNLELTHVPSLLGASQMLRGWTPLEVAQKRFVYLGITRYRWDEPPQYKWRKPEPHYVKSHVYALAVKPNELATLLAGSVNGSYPMLEYDWMAPREIRIADLLAGNYPLALQARAEQILANLAVPA